MLPDFQQTSVWPYNEAAPYRVLPVGVYDCDEGEFRAAFESAFPGSSSRADICNEFFRLRAEAEAEGLNIIQWVDGSFLTTKLDPEDVDVVHFIDYDTFNALSAQQEDFALSVLDGEENTKNTHKTHSFLIYACPPNHPYFPVFEADRQYWLKWWGHTREDKTTGLKMAKGFLRMRVGNGPFPRVP